MIRAAGILFTTKDGKALFLKRAASADFAGTWTIPGGKLEDGETAEQAARREAQEEAGAGVPEGEIALLTRTVRPAGPVEADLPEADLSTLAVPSEQVDFSTFIQSVDEPFPVEIDSESEGYAWAPVNDPPIPLHPGCAVALARLGADELGVARMMVSGDLVSPQPYHNMTMFDIRITGTGIAWRDKDEEFAYRDPSNYINADFLARCAGLPVLWDHPKGSLLTSEEYSNKNVGSVFLPYIKGEEVWAIVKIWDQAAADEMAKGDLSTSPGVSLRNSSNEKVTFENGDILLIEGKPSLLDHVAVCELGVWDKGDEPKGVNTVKADSTMTEAEKKAADEAKAKADAAAKADTDRWGKLDSFMDSMSKHAADSTAKFDSLTSRMDALEKGKTDSSSKKDETEEEKEEREKREREKDDKAKKDAAKKDAKKADESDAEKEEREKKEREEKEKNDAKADSVFDARLKKALDAHLPAHLQTHMPKPISISPEDRAALGAAQARADSVYHAHNQSAPRPLDGETVMAYRRRAASGLQKHSPKLKDVSLDSFADAGLSVAEDIIFNDALEAARNPTDIGPGELREVIQSDPLTGRRRIEFKGEPRAWMDQFKPPIQGVVSRIVRDSHH